MEVATPVLDHGTGQLLEYRALLRHPKFKDAWNLSAANDFDRLAQGKTGRAKGTNTIRFINKAVVPQDLFKDITYIKFVCQDREKGTKSDESHARGESDQSPQRSWHPNCQFSADQDIFKQCYIHTKGEFANADIANVYLMTPLKRPEFAKVQLSDIPAEIIKLYNLEQLATPDGCIYVRVSMGMYGLPQSGSLGHDLLKQGLNDKGYFQS
eukprot:CCRYP_016348-RA/>CCRYP_016348-RA protein AED:0.43 eAED:0.43 QI:0/0/0/1/0/0/2/0/210